MCTKGGTRRNRLEWVANSPSNNRKTHKVKKIRFHDLKKHNLLPLLTNTVATSTSLAKKPAAMTFMKKKRDFSTPRRPHTLLTHQEDIVAIKSLPISTKFSHSSGGRYPLFFYLDLHCLKFQASLQSSDHRRKPITPTRIYFLYYPMIDSLLEEYKIKKLEKWHIPDVKEISQVAWLQWESLAHKPEVTWQLRKHHFILTKAMKEVIKLTK